jgi:TonB family protein
MLQVLVESRAVRARSGSWAVVSIVLHSALIGLALYFTTRTIERAVPSERVEQIIYTAPAPAPAPVTATSVAASVPIAISRLSFAVPTQIVPQVEFPASDIFSRVLTELNSSTSGSTIGAPIGTAAPAGGIYTAATVDRIVVPLPGNSSPAYPTRLSNAGVEGEVLARFVVDSTGGVEAASIEIMQASHALFGDAVKQWLRTNRYSPAQVGGRPVRQLVQQRIGFTLTR